MAIVQGNMILSSCTLTMLGLLKNLNHFGVKGEKANENLTFDIRV